MDSDFLRRRAGGSSSAANTQQLLGPDEIVSAGQTTQLTPDDGIVSSEQSMHLAPDGIALSGQSTQLSPDDAIGIVSPGRDMQLPPSDDGIASPGQDMQLAPADGIASSGRNTQLPSAVARFTTPKLIINLIQNDPNLKNFLRNESGRSCDRCNRTLRELRNRGKAANPPLLASQLLEAQRREPETIDVSSELRAAGTQQAQCQTDQEKIKELLKRIQGLESAKRSAKFRAEKSSEKAGQEIEELGEPDDGRASARAPVVQLSAQNEALRAENVRLQQQVSKLEATIKVAKAIDPTWGVPRKKTRVSPPVPQGPTLPASSIPAPPASPFSL